MEQTSVPGRITRRRGIIIIVISVVVLVLLAALALAASFPGFDVWSQDYIQTVVPRL